MQIKTPISTSLFRDRRSTLAFPRIGQTTIVERAFAVKRNEHVEGGVIRAWQVENA